MTTLEARSAILVVTTHIHLIDELFNRLSSLPKLLRVVAYCKRVTISNKPNTVICSAIELAAALRFIIMTVQNQSFTEEYKHIDNPRIRGIRKLRNLNIFLDDKGLLRVGGRLVHSDIPYDQKHPILLPRTHRFTELLIDDFHKTHNHPGATTLHSIIQQQYWIISGRQTVKSRIKNCISCYRVRPRHVQPPMGDLPPVRLQHIKSFIASGVDYAGPISLKSSSTRRQSISQAYICLFVCMSTKALHLELASDLSTETFLLAFSRFLSRRGPVQNMHSDCGTNFVGASKIFQTVNQFTQSAEYQQKVQSFLACRNINWHFNPPSAPHFGGLWEAGVKSVKTLLHRTIGNHRL